MEPSLPGDPRGQPLPGDPRWQTLPRTDPDGAQPGEEEPRHPMQGQGWAFSCLRRSRQGHMTNLSPEALSEYEEIVSKSFGSEEEGFQFYNKYALEKGFSVRKGYVEWDDDNWEHVLREFVCSREGFRASKHMNREDRKRKARNITRVGCRAKIEIAQYKETGQWYVKDFFDEHNHPLVTRELACLLRSHRRTSDEQKASIVEMQISGIRKHQIMDIMEMQYGGWDNVGFTGRDIYNFCYCYKLETVVAGDAQTIIRHLKARHERDPEFFFKYLVDKKGHLNGLFWSDSQCRLDYEAFGDVVIFNSTYRTNKYNMPFVPFVGLNHHRSTVIFGCGIISHETSESYVWMLRTFSEAMSQKHPISVINDGDLAMQKAIRVVWPNSNHRLCIWHIKQNIFRNLHDDDVKEEFRKFIYDCCSTEELENKWVQFLKRNKVSQDSWLHQMYQMRKLWCAAYQEGRRFLGLRSNQRSERLNSKLHTQLDGKMTLFEMMQHYEHCLSVFRRNEAKLDVEALQSFPFTEPNASFIEKHATHVFTPAIFDLVRWSIHAANKCYLMETEYGGDLVTYIVGKKDSTGTEMKFKVYCDLKERSLYGIMCSCRKLESKGTPCSHIFYVLSVLQVHQVPKCCIAIRWTMSAKSTFPPTRKSSMYEYSENLEWYRELRNLSHAASFKVAHCNESFERLKHVLLVEAGTPSSGNNGAMRYGPVLAQNQEFVSVNGGNVMDPEHVKGRGAPKKRFQAMEKKISKKKCSHCKQIGHNRRTCSKTKEKNKVPESW